VRFALGFSARVGFKSWWAGVFARLVLHTFLL